MLCGGTSVSPSLLLPQQTARASVLSAHVWKAPAVIFVTLPRFGGIIVSPRR